MFARKRALLLMCALDFVCEGVPCKSVREVPFHPVHLQPPQLQQPRRPLRSRRNTHHFEHGPNSHQSKIRSKVSVSHLFMLWRPVDYIG